MVACVGTNKGSIPYLDDVKKSSKSMTASGASTSK